MLAAVKDCDASNCEIYQKQIEFMYDNAMSQRRDEPVALEGGFLGKEVNERILSVVRGHLTKPQHPIVKLIAKFEKIFE
jgi:hypothetical protein